MFSRVLFAEKGPSSSRRGDKHTYEGGSVSVLFDYVGSSGACSPPTQSISLD